MTKEASHRRSQIASQIIDCLHQKELISDTLAFDARAIIGLEEAFKAMINDVISIQNRITKSTTDIQENVECRCWPWTRASKRTVYSTTPTVEPPNKSKVQT
jgi:hypothetical protein